MSTLIIINARLESTRYPRKHLERISPNFTLIDLLVGRLKKIKLDNNIDSKIIIATAKTKMNSEFLKIAKFHDIGFFCGDENNILKRHFQVAKQFKAKYLINVDGDDPLISSEAFCAVYKKLQAQFDAVASFGWPLGMNVWGYKTDIFQKLSAHLNRAINDVGWNKDLLDKTNLKKVFSGVDLSKYRKLRLTVDYDDDIKLFQKLSACCDLINSKDNEILDTILSRNLDLINGHLNDEYWANFEKGRSINE